MSNEYGVSVPSTGLINVPTTKRRGRPPKEESVTNKGNLSLQLRDLASKEFGATRVKTIEEFLDSVYGIPLYRNLPMQYLLKIDVFPLERTMSISGEQGAAKTSLLWYLIKLFAFFSGQGVYLDAEKKVNPDQAAAIINSPVLIKSVLPLPINSLEEMFKAFRLFASQYNLGNVPKDVPMLIGVDSLGYLTKQEELDASGKNDIKGYQGMQNAAFVKQQLMEILQNHIPNNPISLVMLNHQMAIPPQQGGFKPGFMPVVHNEPGGGFKEYSYSIKLEMHKGAVLKQGFKKTPTYNIKIQKNSMGEKETSAIVVPYQTIFMKETRAEIISFDWDYALVELLENKVSKTELTEVFDLRVASKTKCSSKMLGVEDISWSEMGTMIHANTELSNAISQVLRIKAKRKFGKAQAPEVWEAIHVKPLDLTEVTEETAESEDDGPVGTPSPDLLEAPAAGDAEQ